MGGNWDTMSLYLVIHQSWYSVLEDDEHHAEPEVVRCDEQRQDMP